MLKNILRRYTDLNALIYLLKNKAITMLDPRSWSDINDSYSLSIHKEKRSLKSLLVLCFAQTSEKYHHWHVFANGPTGVCISFKYESLIDSIASISGISYGSVEYLYIQHLKERLKSNQPINLPFIKRYGFKDEREYRIIYEDHNTSYETRDIPIPLTAIDRIEINPWIPEVLFNSTSEVLRDIDGVDKMRITRSTLLNNKRWKELAGK